MTFKCFTQLRIFFKSERRIFGNALFFRFEYVIIISNTINCIILKNNLFFAFLFVFQI